MNYSRCIFAASFPVCYDIVGFCKEIQLLFFSISLFSSIPDQELLFVSSVKAFKRRFRGDKDKHIQYSICNGIYLR